MLAEKLSEDVLLDKYFNELFLKASKLLAISIFSDVSNNDLLNDKEIIDLLQFADILSLSKKSINRNKAYQIISLLNERYYNNPYYKTFSHSVLAKLGNFPAINYLKLTNNNNSELPYDRLFEKSIKEINQTIPHSQGLVFTDSQYELYKQISESKFFSFSGPTSMGKSFIIKSFIRKAITNSPPENIVILVPTRALINQFSIDLNSELKDSLKSYNYKVATNSNVSEMEQGNKQLYILVLTPERLISYLSQQKNPPIGYLFVDEAHKIAADKDMRSLTAFNAISRALRINSNLNLYFASPNVSNPEVFLKLFKKSIKNSFNTTEAPVSQNLFFINLVEKRVTHFIDTNEIYDFTPQILEQNKVPDLILKIGKSLNNLIYCSSRNNSVERALELYNKLPDKDEATSAIIKKAIRQIKTYVHKDFYLADFLNRGVAYHFGNLPQIIRNKIEFLFKESHINYVFCTSTLLEGVNLPAKNVFILNDKNGIHTLDKIDFWNLAGRAGRLKYELSGNIFCIKENEKDWKHIELLDKTEIVLKPTVDTLIDKNLKKISEMIQNNPDITVKTETLREILQYIANIISIDTLEIDRANYRSPIIDKLIQDNKQTIIDLAKKANSNIEVPSSILLSNQSIKIDIQDLVYKELKKWANNPSEIRLPSTIDYATCKTWLRVFYKLFQWDKYERDFKKETQLDYYAMLMNQWINGFSLNSIINQSIEYYDTNNRQIKVGYAPTDMEVFSSKNKKHVNILIANIIEDVEYILKHIFEKYFNNYYTILVNILGEENAGVNWATFLEYGTRNSIVIALQNYGLSRHTANYIFQNYRNCLETQGDRLIKIDVGLLRKSVSQDAIEFDEIKSILF